MNKGKVAAIVIVVAALLAYLLYFKEYFAYQNVLENPDEFYVFEDYYYEFPDGRYYEDVKLFEIEHKRDITLVRDYFREFPDGKGTEQVVELKNQLWDDEIQKYNDLVAGEEKTEAIAFFGDLLNHMKENNSSTIYVTFDQTIDLRDFQDFSDEILDITSELYETTEAELSNNMLGLKENFSEGSINVLEEIVDDGIKESFEAIFSDNFISVQSHDGEVEEGALHINIEYTIRNQLEQGIDMPVIWEYHENNIFQAYLLGIAIDFGFHFALPGTEQVYAFEREANPGENISGIQDIADGYERMTQITFADYANHISDQFGLQGIYFQQEAEPEYEEEYYEGS